MPILSLNNLLWVIIINISESPICELFEFTKLLNSKQMELIPNGFSERCIYATIINRCYYSSYSYASAWLKKKYDFIPLKPHEFSNPKDYKSAHKQVQDALVDYNRGDVKNKLKSLFILRKKADYPPFNRLTLKQVNDCMDNMEYVFNRLPRRDLGFID